MTAVQTIPVTSITGEDTDLGQYAGSVLLVVNVASKCGLTPQYEGLEALYRTYRDQGFHVLGFPANNFREQEPGTDEEILEFCRATYSVDFPMFSKISVCGDDQHPLYAALTSAIGRAAGDPDTHRARLEAYGIEANQDPDVLWNFEKFLIGRNGEVIGRFAPSMEPEAPELIAAIEDALAQ